jgi:hypothetical protein
MLAKSVTHCDCPYLSELENGVLTVSNKLIKLQPYLSTAIN